MSARPKKQRNNGKESKRFVDVQDLAKGMKSGEMKLINKNTYLIPVFVLDPPEQIKKPGKSKPKKKSP